MSIDVPGQAAPAARLSEFSADYAAALAAYAGQGDETDLVAAFHLARGGMALGISLTALCEIHQEAVGPLPRRSVRNDDFLIEALSVYDMALRGHLDTIGQLRREAEERQRAETELRQASFALRRERDRLEAEVQRRMRQAMAAAAPPAAAGPGAEGFVRALATDLRQAVVIQDAAVVPPSGAPAPDRAEPPGQFRGFLEEVIEGFQPSPPASVPLSDLLARALPEARTQGELPVIAGRPAQLWLALRLLCRQVLQPADCRPAPQVTVAVETDAASARLILTARPTPRLPPNGDPPLALCRAILAAQGGLLESADPASGIRLTLPLAAEPP
ncbi:hypothetical protein [Mangrovicoccus algicola]|uniref:Uncharacterized protein n=1 Tax=Mangrovicoccus algicola TaxID=2771008 RepID=A0A8J6ZC65_9RHOB|nr:hypothetical protein [Mangrovicoccus algicola]MBE3639836.1 hypothetical protein [Mangrovicoccus algicola]